MENLVDNQMFLIPVAIYRRMLLLAFQYNENPMEKDTFCPLDADIAHQTVER